MPRHPDQTDSKSSDGAIVQRRGVGRRDSPPEQQPRPAFGRRGLTADNPQPLAAASRAPTIPGPEASFAEFLTADSDLRCFFGANADYYIAAREAARDGKRRYKMNWAAALAGLFWVFYRRLYLLGFAMIAFFVFLAFGLPQLADLPTDKLSIPLWITFGFVANDVYGRRAAKFIALADEQGLTGADRVRFLSSAGGTSLIGLLFSIVVLPAGFVLPLVLAPAAFVGLPACDSAEVRGLLDKIMRDNLSRAGRPMGRPRMDDVRTATSSDKMNSCTMRLTVDNEALNVSYEVAWEDDSRRRFVVRITRATP